MSEPDLAAWLGAIAPQWAWLTLGVLLAGLEMLLPGYYLIWVALAAIITGVVAALTPISLPWEVASFAVLAVVTVYSARRFLNDNPIVSSDPLMNRRGARMIGQKAMVVEAISHGSGRVRFGDGEWIACGADAGAGEWVKVTGSDGATLLVEPLPALPQQGPEAA